jgi:hypothetical protein
VVGVRVVGSVLRLAVPLRPHAATTRSSSAHAAQRLRAGGGCG